MNNTNTITKVIIIGMGGHSGVLLEILKLHNYSILGVTDTHLNIENIKINDLKYLGTDQEILKYKPHDISLVNGIGSTSDLTLRKNIHDKFTSMGYHFLSLIHPTAYISPTATIENGTQIMAGVIIQPHVQIGKNCIINTKTSIDHNCHIGSHVHLAPGVTLSGGVKIGDESHIGVGSSIVQGVSLGKKTLAGAGSVITKSWEGPLIEGEFLAGVPARILNKPLNR